MAAGGDGARKRVGGAIEETLKHSWGIILVVFVQPVDLGGVY